MLDQEGIRKKPKVIFIDWNKTLSNSHFWRNLPDVETVLFLANRDLLAPWMKNEYSSEDICQALSAQTGIPYEDIFKALQESCATMEFVDPKLPELIAKVRANGIKVVLATDNMDCFTRFTVPALHLDQIFDDTLASCDLKILKRDVETNSIPFFDGYLKKNGFTYAEAVLLDDFVEMGKLYSRLGLDVDVVRNVSELIEALENYAKIAD
jgi:FMN phosphatase YigB (HAD superfamily)